MPKLQEIIKNLAIEIVQGDLEMEIPSLHFDSRKIEHGALFVAVKGLQTDGHLYISQALVRGAKAIFCEDLPEHLQEGICYLRSNQTARHLGQMAANFYGNPSHRLKVVGVTGTNGKTSTVTLLFRLFRRLGYHVGLLSTVQNQINEEVLPTDYTTPDAVEIQSLFTEMLRRGCTYCFMEVSSHALIQERTSGIEFSGAIFTNITHDHLDYHGTFDNYIRAKKKFFDELSQSAFALVNLDDKRGAVMLQNCQASVQKTFALHAMADFKSKIIENTIQGLLLHIHEQEIWFRLIGDFNAYNLLGVYAAASLCGEDPDAILTELSALTPPPGRFEQIGSDRGITAIVDYAHTPDALKNVLETISELRNSEQKIITVVGCGGDRDKTKRPIMAQIAVTYSNQVIFTSDNPRTEEPMQILKDMLDGVEDKEKVLVIENRREAIERACQLAQHKDIILVAGKGHENYQEIQGIKYPFDDKAVLKEYLSN
ncbi:MAG: UDP-N-acetylmuramoyl-L-alanyl-D-glutamate--2,6-diaminopimelate ligase [Microscillaceae bacterium]|nr:UDP-N-acetylmuramoyl-L-alanyl-D-glutamate--2,6-diaminopimelate ligase [Microscillaceae bacterium]